MIHSPPTNNRIAKYLKLPVEVYVLAYAYMERLVQNVNLELSRLNEHRIVLLAVRVASKYLEDKHYDNSYWSEIGGISNSELNFLELAFSYALAFRLYVPVEEFEALKLRLTTWSSPLGRCRRRSAHSIHQFEDILREHLIDIVQSTKENRMWQRRAGEIESVPSPVEVGGTNFDDDDDDDESEPMVPSTPPTPKHSPDAINVERENKNSRGIENTFTKFSSDDKAQRLDRFASNFARSIRIL